MHSTNFTQTLSKGPYIVKSNMHFTSSLIQTLFKGPYRVKSNTYSTSSTIQTLSRNLKQIVELKAKKVAIKVEMKAVKENAALVYIVVDAANAKTNKFVYTTASSLVNNI